MCYGDQDLDYNDDHRYSMNYFQNVYDLPTKYVFNLYNWIMIVARDYYYLTYGSIQKDVLNYGPIEASFDVYDDFPSYKSGKCADRSW